MPQWTKVAAGINVLLPISFSPHLLNHGTGHWNEPFVTCGELSCTFPHPQWNVHSFLHVGFKNRFFDQKVSNAQVLKPHLLWINLFIKSPLSYHTPVTMGSIAMSDNESLIKRKQKTYIFLMVCKKKCLINAWFDKFYVILILVYRQKSRGQMSLAVKCPAVKSHLRSNVPRSNVTCGQMSLAVKCPRVKCHLRDLTNYMWF